MQFEASKISDAAVNTDGIEEIEAAELELREDLLGSLSLFSCCCPCYPSNPF